jgi:hypothetical protein
MMLTTLLSCDKIIDVELPQYDSELVVEMYLEQGEPLRCLLTESLPYTDTAINKPVNDAVVIFSDGTTNDTLAYKINQDIVTGRFFNYYHPKIITADSNKIYTLTVVGHSKKVTASTTFSQRISTIDSLIVKESTSEEDSFSVGLAFTDPADTENYYRILIGKEINHFNSDPSDFRISDISFNGKQFSYFSEPDFAVNDTLTVKIYSLTRDHYEYLESAGNARRSNFNPFSQPGRIKSNIDGGLGIFTSIRYREEKIIIK